MHTVEGMYVVCVTVVPSKVMTHVTHLHDFVKLLAKISHYLFTYCNVDLLCIHILYIVHNIIYICIHGVYIHTSITFLLCVTVISS